MFVETSMGKVYYSTLGEGNPVVLIHGFGTSHVQWMYTSQALALAGYRAMSLDLPGFGQSDMPTQTITTDRYADVVLELLRKLNIKSPVLVGSSMGGFVAWLCASRLGHDVSGLILANTAGAPDSQNLPPRNKRKRRHPMGVVSTPTLGAVLGLKITNPLTRMIVRPIIHKSFGDVSRLTPEVFECLHLAAKQSRIVFQRRLEFAKMDDPGSVLSIIKCPTLIMWGDKDQIVRISAMDYFVDHIIHAKLKVYFGVGHLPMLEIPHEFNSDLLGFLTTVDGLTNPGSHR